MGAIWNALVAISDLIEHHIGAITAIIATAAVIQWRETRLTAERQLRAYVLNSTADLVDGSKVLKAVVDRSNQAAVSITIKNFGQTPAYKIKHRAEIDVAQVANEERMSIPLDIMKNDPAFILGPGNTASAHRWLNRALSPQEIAGIQAGTHAIYAFGRIEYIDAFKTPRWSTYRLKYSAKAWPPVSEGSVGMDFCTGGNDAN